MISPVGSSVWAQMPMHGPSLCLYPIVTDPKNDRQTEMQKKIDRQTTRMT
jgi:hypothetical protein